MVRTNVLEERKNDDDDDGDEARRRGGNGFRDDSGIGEGSAAAAEEKQKQEEEEEEEEEMEEKEEEEKQSRRTLAYASRLFDAFLVSHPLIPLYVGVAAMIAQRERVLAAGVEDPAELHQTLSKLPLVEGLGDDGDDDDDDARDGDGSIGDGEYATCLHDDRDGDCDRRDTWRTLSVL